MGCHNRDSLGDKPGALQTERPACRWKHHITHRLAHRTRLLDDINKKNLQHTTRTVMKKHPHEVIGLTTDTQKFRIGLLRRLWSIRSKRSRSRSVRMKVETRAERSFAINYLVSFDHPNQIDSLEVELCKVTLEIANEDGREAAIEFIDDFEDRTSAEYARFAISSLENPYSPIGVEIDDRYLFPASFEVDALLSGKRSCYETALKTFDISLPFAKSGMLRLLTAVDRDYRYSKIYSFRQIRGFVWDFLIRTWPLFDNSVLQIALSYFDFRQKIPFETIVSQHKILHQYGLERLQVRLLALRAVCGDTESISALTSTEMLSSGQFETQHRTTIEHFLRNEETEIALGQIVNLKNANPIEVAILLVIYLKNSKSSHEFLTRLLDVYVVDSSVLELVDWTSQLEKIEDTGYFCIPELVGMAAIMTEGKVLDNSPSVKSKYVPTGASTDLYNFARHCREENGMTAYQFFKSFSKLHRTVQRSVFRYLLRPGIIDRIVNVFPSETDLPDSLERNEAINALSLKLDCLSFLKKRNIVSPYQLAVSEEETRQRLRQIKYEVEASGGRIRLSHAKISRQISVFIGEYWRTSRYFSSQSEISDEAIRQLLEARAKSQLSQSISTFVCFESKSALDYLLSNLRHNFLRFKIERAIDDAFTGTSGYRVNLFKECIGDLLEEFCTKWLTISPRRSFMENMRAEIISLNLITRDHSIEDREKLSDKVAAIVMDHFERLLLACRTAWSSIYCRRTIEILTQRLARVKEGVDTGLKDRIESNVSRAFQESEMWMTINPKPIASEFGLKELFVFESTNFSSAKTRTRPIQVQCFKVQMDFGKPTRVSRDVKVPGTYFDAMVQLVHNLLENAFKHSGLSISNTHIEVKIIDSAPKGVVIEFRNKFAPEKRSEMRSRLAHFTEAFLGALESASRAPLSSGGSGLKRIVFELYNVFKSDFELSASDREFNKDTFLVTCRVPLMVAKDNV